MACRRLYGNTCGISNSRGIDFLVRTVGIKGQNISAAFFAVPGGAERMSLIPTVNPTRDKRPGKHIKSSVRTRGDRQQKAFTVRSKQNVARPVMSRRNAFDNTLGLGGGLQVTVPVRETNDAVAVGNVDPLGIRSLRIECDSVRLMKPGNKHVTDCRLGGSRRNPIHAYLVLRAVGYEKVPIWRSTDGPRLRKTRCNEFGRESIRDSRSRSGRHRNYLDKAR